MLVQFCMRLELSCAHFLLACVLLGAAAGFSPCTVHQHRVLRGRGLHRERGVFVSMATSEKVLNIVTFDIDGTICVSDKMTQGVVLCCM